MISDRLWRSRFGALDEVVGLVGRLAPGVTVASAQAEAEAVLPLVTALPEVLRAEARRPLLLFLAAFGLVLLVAYANVTGLLLARRLSRRDELAVRLALGAPRWRVVTHALAEAGWLAGAGAMLGLLLARWAVAAVEVAQVVRAPYHAGASFDGPVWVFTLAAGPESSSLGRDRYRRPCGSGGLTSPAVRTLYVPFAEYPFKNLSLVARTSGDPAALLPSLRRAIHGLDREIMFGAAQPLPEIVAEAVAQPRFQTAALVVLALVALALTACGLSGVVAYAVAQRTGEIAVRVALGANSGAVVRMVMRQGLAVSVAGLVLGLLGALALSRFLDTLLFEVSPTDPFAFLLSAVGVLLVALLASYLPARRAAVVDPAGRAQSGLAGDDGDPASVLAAEGRRVTLPRADRYLNIDIA